VEEESPHIINILRQAVVALKNENAVELKELSNQTIHCASCMQDSGSITIAVLNYALGKILERNQHIRIKTWPAIVKKISLFYEIAAKSLEREDVADYERSIIEARRVLTGISDVKQAVKEVLRKASINKASRMYEHGISLGQTANLLGVTQWELSEYAAQSITGEGKFTRTVDAVQRAKMALEFFS
jgi:hypothetical protein